MADSNDKQKSNTGTKKSLILVANVIIEVLMLSAIGLVIGFIITGNVGDALSWASPIIAAYLVLDIYLVIRKKRTGFLRISLVKP